jgi:putative colanic acid biosynthesis acetyltransferase WcaB
VTIGNRIDRDGNEGGWPTLGDDVELGAGCAVIGDLAVGDHARIGALAVVVKSVPEWGVVVGNPGRVIRIDAPTGSM